MRVVPVEIHTELLSELFDLSFDVKIIGVKEGRETFRVYLESERFEDVKDPEALSPECLVMSHFKSPLLLEIGKYKIREVEVKEIKPDPIKA